ncbi:MarR family transcriptional regulator [Halalkalibacter akibai]|uniref:Uncharacterized protein n=1 Tax=Halalkalibacter akibai (strain ATCC 43226 / DSM 21942 / CIP 109018 / JCM 9157 / 1139) TaxID=1236973 RepID=W4QUI4_HALA3|nr:MarR family transcriptional regulator [Halalkalibacter akibai]GAE34974.1 hypothetical protein JCM9157_2062 [Halalkalibacter akibai JCM 9157]
MGAWGTGLYDDDTTCDVRDEFLEYFLAGHTAEEATKAILAEYEEEFSLDEDLEVLSLVYIGLAGIQIKKKCLLDHVRQTTIACIDKGADLELWEEAEKKDYQERKEILLQFKQKLIAYK